MPTSKRISGLRLLEVWPDNNVSDVFERLRRPWAYPVDILIGHFDIASFAVYATRDWLLARRVNNERARSNRVCKQNWCSGTAMIEAAKDNEMGGLTSVN